MNNFPVSFKLLSGSFDVYLILFERIVQVNYSNKCFRRPRNDKKIRKKETITIIETLIVF